jgi:uncharacterized protein (TIGR03000 family)
MIWRRIRWVTLVALIAIGGAPSQAVAQYAVRGGPTMPVRGPSLYVGAYAPNFFPGPLPQSFVGAGASFVPNYASSYPPNRPITVFSVPTAPAFPPIGYYSEVYIPPHRTLALDTDLPAIPPAMPQQQRSLSTAEPPAPAPPQTPPAATGVAHFTVKLPADAKLWVNEAETKPAGTSRRFHTPTNLESGRSYEYTFRAQWTENAQTVTRDRNVRFKAGEDLTVDFTQSPGR